MKRKKNEAIAILGMGLRLPGGVRNSKDYWEKLLVGFDAITKIPPDRWNADAYYHPDWTVGTKINTTRGGFIDEIDQFDPDFFHVAPLEAPYMDPQQRLLLEITYHAFEDAGITLEKISGTRCGVYIGSSVCDYNMFQRHPENVVNCSAYTSTGVTQAILANRISHVFNLKGPSLTIDTACSSSLTSLHFAMQALRTQECEIAIVGGINIIISPETSIGQSKGGFVSPDGHCKAFDAAANGYVRSEGAVVLILVSQKDAHLYSRNPYASILSTTINHNGRNIGLSAPSEKAQKELIQMGLQAAQLDSKKIDYIEAHGTGTIVGDLIEANAIGKVFGKGRRSPLYIGSVKANIGHIEAASGLAGLAKLALSLKNDLIPPHPTFSEPNARIPFKKYQLALPRAPQKYRHKHRRFAALNSFGFGGSNAFAVLTSAKAPPMQVKSKAKPYLFLLSAHCRPSLEKICLAYSDFLANSKADIRDICYSASLHHSHFSHRFSVVVSSIDELRVELEAFAANRIGKHHFRTVSATKKRKIAFVMTGQGGEWPGMGMELLGNPRFSHFYDIDTAAYIQADKASNISLITIQTALSEFLIDCDIRPHAFVGDNIGEVIAAQQSGILSKRAAIRIVEEFPEKTIRIKHANPKVDFYSTVTGKKETRLAKDHWSKNLRKTIHFSNAIDSLTKDGFNIFIEIGPRPTHVIDIYNITNFNQKPDIIVQTTLDPKKNDLEAILETIGSLWADGIRINLKSIFTESFNSISLPNYIWNKKSFWSESAEGKEKRIKPQINHPFFHAIHSSLGAEKIDLISLVCDARIHAFISSGFSFNKKILSPFYLLECMAAAQHRSTQNNRISLQDIKFKAPIFLDPAGNPPKLQLDRFDSSGSSQIHSFNSHDKTWDLAVSAASYKNPPALEIAQAKLEKTRLLDEKDMDVGSIYMELAEQGLQVPTEFQIMKSLKKSSGTVSAHFSIPVTMRHGFSDFVIHPILLDACLHAATPLFSNHQERNFELGIFVPKLIEKCSFATLSERPIEVSHFFALIEECQSDPKDHCINISIFDKAGHNLARLEGMHLDFLGSTKNELIPSTPKYYQQEWNTTTTVAQHANRPMAFSSVLPPNWIVFTPRNFDIETIKALFHKESLRLVTVEKSADFINGDFNFGINPHDRAHYEKLLSQLKDFLGAEYGILYLWSLEDHSMIPATSSDLLELVQNACMPLSYLAQATGTLNLPFASKWVFATKAAQELNDSAPLSYSGSAILAQMRVLAREYPMSRFISVDIEEEHSPIELCSLFYEIFQNRIHPEVAYRNGERYLLRYNEQSPNSLQPQSLSPHSFDKNASYLVTGGSTGLGLRIAHWLSQNEAAHLVLLSRHGPRSKEDANLIELLRKQSATLREVRLDVSNYEHLSTLINELTHGKNKLKGIFHAAAQYEDGPIADLSSERLERVLLPKTIGAFNLHLASAHLDLDHFLLISSIAALFGNAGQANYAIANQLLSAIVRMRSLLGLRAQMISFGPIADSGILFNNKKILSSLMKQGLQPMALSQFEDALHKAVSSGQEYLTLAQIDWKLFSRFHHSAHDQRFKHIFASEIAADERLDEKNSLEIRQKITDEKDQTKRQEIVSSLIRNEMSRIIGISANHYNFEKPLRELGIDSLMGLQLRLFININFRIEITYLQVVSSEGLRDLTNRVLKLFDAIIRKENDHAVPAPS